MGSSRDKPFRPSRPRSYYIQAGEEIVKLGSLDEHYTLDGVLVYPLAGWLNNRKSNSKYRVGVSSRFSALSRCGAISTNRNQIIYSIDVSTGIEGVFNSDMHFDSAPELKPSMKLLRSSFKEN